MPGGSVQRERELQCAAIYAFLFTLGHGECWINRVELYCPKSRGGTAPLPVCWPRGARKTSLFMKYSQSKSFVGIKEYLWDGQSELQGNKTPQIRSHLTRRKKALNEIRGMKVP